MEILEQARPADPVTTAALRSFVQKVSARSDFSGAILFGSRARRSHQSDSDADVAVLLSGSPGKFVSTKLAMDDLAYEVLLDGPASIIERDRITFIIGNQSQIFDFIQRFPEFDMNRPGFTRHFLAYKFRASRGCHEWEAIYRGISN